MQRAIQEKKTAILSPPWGAASVHLRDPDKSLGDRCKERLRDLFIHKQACLWHEETKPENSPVVAQKIWNLATRARLWHFCCKPYTQHHIPSWLKQDRTVALFSIITKYCNFWQSAYPLNYKVWRGLTGWEWKHTQLVYSPTRTKFLMLCFQWVKF